MNRKMFPSLALAGGLAICNAHAISLDAIQLWAGSGTNRAALVIEWSTPEILTDTTVPAPIADKTLVWGYRFDATNATGTQMLRAILAADPRLYVVADETYGTCLLPRICGYSGIRNGGCQGRS
ncbi:MAG: hypothetical protein ACLQVX_12960 [Limisphaerales bacterium]